MQALTAQDDIAFQLVQLFVEVEQVYAVFVVCRSIASPGSDQPVEVAQVSREGRPLPRRKFSAAGGVHVPFILDSTARREDCMHLDAFG